MSGGSENDYIRLVINVFSAIPIMVALIVSGFITLVLSSGVVIALIEAVIYIEQKFR